MSPDIYDDLAKSYLGSQTTPQTSDINVDDLLTRMRGSVREQESGGGRNTVNRDSGATGDFQVMPANIPAWTKKWYGRELTRDEFLKDRNAQDIVFNGQMGEYLREAQKKSGGDQDKTVRMAASAWYSGKYDLYDNDRPQYSNGRQYPSIRAYTLGILNKLNKNKPQIGNPYESLAQNYLQQTPNIQQNSNPYESLAEKTLTQNETVPQDDVSQFMQEGSGNTVQSNGDITIKPLGTDQVPQATQNGRQPIGTAVQSQPLDINDPLTIQKQNLERDLADAIQKNDKKREQEIRKSLELFEKNKPYSRVITPIGDNQPTVANQTQTQTLGDQTQQTTGQTQKLTFKDSTGEWVESDNQENVAAGYKRLTNKDTGRSVVLKPSADGKKVEDYKEEFPDWLTGKTIGATPLGARQKEYDAFLSTNDLGDTEERRQKFLKEGYSAKDLEYLNIYKGEAEKQNKQVRRQKAQKIERNLPTVTQVQNGQTVQTVSKPDFTTSGKLVVPMNDKNGVQTFEKPVTLKFDKNNQEDLEEGEYRLIGEDGEPYIFAGGRIVAENANDVVETLNVSLAKKDSVTVDVARRNQATQVADAISEKYGLKREDVIDFWDNYGFRNLETGENNKDEDYFTKGADKKFYEGNFENRLGDEQNAGTTPVQITERDINLMREFSNRRATLSPQIEAVANDYLQKGDKMPYIAAVKAQRDLGLMPTDKADKEIAAYEELYKQNYDYYSISSPQFDELGNRIISDADAAEKANTATLKELGDNLKQSGSFAAKVEENRRIEALPFWTRKVPEMGKEILRTIPAAYEAVLKTFGGLSAANPLSLENLYNAARTGGSIGDRIKTEDSYLYQGGKSFEYMKNEMIPSDPLARRSYWVTATGGLSQGILWAALAYASGGTAIPTVMGLSQGYAEQQDNAIKEGATQNEQLARGLIGATLAVPDILLQNKFFKSLTKAEQTGFVRQLFANVYNGLKSKVGEKLAASTTEKGVAAFLGRLAKNGIDLGKNIGDFFDVKNPLGKAAVGVGYETIQESVLEGKGNKLAAKLINNPKITFGDLVSVDDDFKHDAVGGAAGGLLGGSFEVSAEAYQKRQRIFNGILDSATKNSFTLGGQNFDLTDAIKPVITEYRTLNKELNVLEQKINKNIKAAKTLGESEGNITKKADLVEEAVSLKNEIKIKLERRNELEKEILDRTGFKEEAQTKTAQTDTADTMLWNGEEVKVIDSTPKEFEGEQFVTVEKDGKEIQVSVTELTPKTEETVTETETATPTDELSDGAKVNIKDIGEGVVVKREKNGQYLVDFNPRVKSSGETVYQSRKSVRAKDLSPVSQTDSNLTQEIKVSPLAKQKTNGETVNEFFVDENNQVRAKDELPIKNEKISKPSAQQNESALLPNQDTQGGNVQPKVDKTTSTPIKTTANTDDLVNSPTNKQSIMATIEASGLDEKQKHKLTRRVKELTDAIENEDDKEALSVLQKLRNRTQDNPQIQSAIDRLEELYEKQGYKVYGGDWVGMEVPDNGVLSFRVLAYQEDETITDGKDRVIEVVSPQIDKDGKTIQYAQVIVGTPVKQTSATTDTQNSLGKSLTEKAKDFPQDTSAQSITKNDKDSSATNDVKSDTAKTDRSAKITDKRAVENIKQKARTRIKGKSSVAVETTSGKSLAENEKDFPQEQKSDSAQVNLDKTISEVLETSNKRQATNGRIKELQSEQRELKRKQDRASSPTKIQQIESEINRIESEIAKLEDSAPTNIDNKQAFVVDGRNITYGDLQAPAQGIIYKGRDSKNYRPIKDLGLSNSQETFVVVDDNGKLSVKSEKDFLPNKNFTGLQMERDFDQNDKTVAEVLQTQKNPLKMVSSTQDWGSAEYTKRRDAIPLEKNADGKLLAPNGKVSNLQNADLWRTVRTDEFKKWFGDWINNPKEASKVVDSNGEPLVVYHGTESGDIESFEIDPAFTEGAVFFTDDAPITASGFATKFSGTSSKNLERGMSEPTVYPVFLNLRNPKKGTSQEIDVIDTEEGIVNAKNNQNDGIIISNVKEFEKEATTYVAFNPNQIKSVFNRGSFSENEDSILKMVRNNDSRTKQAELAQSEYLDDIIPNVESTRKSDANGNNIVELNEEAAEIIRTVLADIANQDRATAPNLSGTLLSPATVKPSEVSDAILAYAEEAESEGLDVSALDKLADAIIDAEKDNGTVRLVVFDDALAHETVHQQSELGVTDSERKNLTSRRDIKGLRVLANDKTADGKTFRKMFDKWAKAENYDWKPETAKDWQLGHAAEEIFAYVSDGDTLGADVESAAKIAVRLNLLYAQARQKEARSAGKPRPTIREALKTFDNTSASRYIDDTGESNEGNARNNTNTTESGGSRTVQEDVGRQNDSGNGRDNQTTDSRKTERETGTAKAPKISDKLSNTPKTLRDAGVPLDDRFYTGTTNAEQQSFANAKLDKGVDEADKWLKDAVADGDHHNGATTAVALSLMNHYGKTGQIAELNAVADKIVPMLTEAGQAIQAMALVSVYNPETAGTYAAKVKKQKTGKDITPAEHQKAVDLATALSETAKADGISKALLEKANEAVKELETENQTLLEVNKILDGRASKLELNLTDAAKNIRNLKAKVKRLEESKPKTSRKGNPSVYYRKLIAKQSDIKKRLSESFGDSLALKMVAWHGSPHVFDKFSIDKIGTGEGAQIYGYGLYFTDAEAVADHYKDALSALRPVINGQNVDVFAKNKPAYADVAKDVADWFGGYQNGIKDFLNTRYDNQIAELESSVKRFAGNDSPTVLSMVEKGQEKINALKDKKRKLEYVDITNSKGAKYEVDLKPSEDEYLLWDKPLSEQSEKVKKALNSKPMAQKDITGEQIYKNLSNEKGTKANNNHPTWMQDVSIPSDKAASEYLKSLGIRGIKYLDGTSRNKGEGSYNYVIFDDADVEIKQILKMVSPSTRELSADETQDLTDFAALEIINHSSYADTISKLEEITKGEVSDEDIQQIHAAAVESLEGAPMSDTQKANAKLRAEHRKQADLFTNRFQGDVNDALRNIAEKMSNTKSEQTFANLVLGIGTKGNYSDAAIQAALLRKTLSPDESIKELNKDYPDLKPTEIRQALKESDKIYTEAKQEIVRVRLLAKSQVSLGKKQIERIENERRANSITKSKATNQANAFYAGLSKSTPLVLAETAVNYRKANLLSAVKTHLKNMVGNTAFAASEEGERMIASIADAIASYSTHQRSIQGLSLKGVAQGFKSIFKQDETLKNIDADSGLTMAKNIMRYGDTVDNMTKQQLTESHLKEKFNFLKVGTIADAYINFVFRTLSAEDALFKAYAFRRSLEEQAHVIAKNEHTADASVNVKSRRKELITNPTNVMQLTAQEYADFATFQNDNWFTSNVTNKLKSSNPYIKTGIELLVPFDKTPTNIINRVLDHTPVGVAKAAYELYKLKTKPDSATKKINVEYRGAVEKDLQSLADWDSFSADKKRRLIEKGLNRVFDQKTQREFARLVGSSVAGTAALIPLGFILASMGLMAGAFSPDDDDRDETNIFFDRMKEGIEPGSILIPGLGRFRLPDSPFAKAMLFGATMYEQGELARLQQKDAVGAVMEGVSDSTKDAVFEQPLMRELKEMWTKKNNTIGGFTGNLASGFIPASSMVRSISEITDDEQRKQSGYTEKEAKGATTADIQGTAFKRSFFGGVPFVRKTTNPVSGTAVPQYERGGWLRRLAREFDFTNFRSNKNETGVEIKKKAKK